MAASYPSSVKSFSSFNDGDVIQDEHIEEAYDEIAAIEQELVTSGLTNPLKVNANIKFPATQVPSADANTLDDYEEGTFTPVLNFGGATTGITYTTQSGTYTVIGNLVHVEIRLDLSSKGSASGAATITGLPFAAVGFPSCIVDAVVGMSGVTDVAWAPISGTTLTLFQGARSALTDANFGNTSEIRIGITYRR
jgi:hypothetical protein